MLGNGNPRPERGHGSGHGQVISFFRKSEGNSGAAEVQARQKQLKRYAGKLVIIGGNFAPVNSNLDPWEITENLGIILERADIVVAHSKPKDYPVGIRSIVPDILKTDGQSEWVEPGTDERTERAAVLVGAELHGNHEYGIDPHHIREPQRLAIRGTGTPTERMYRAIASAIDDEEQWVRDYLHKDPEEIVPGIILFMRVRIACSMLPSIKPGDLNGGGAVMLEVVGKTPEENLWSDRL